LLASDLGVALDFVNIKDEDMARLLDQGRVDIVAGGLAVTPERALRMRFTVPTMQATLAFIVRDHERKRFSTVDKLKNEGALRVATFDVPYYNNLARAALPKIELITIKSPTEFFKAPEGQFDAMLFSAEAGSAWTLIFPKFTVAVPKPGIVTGPIAPATPKNAPELHAYVSTWVALKKENGITKILYDHWILGRGAKSTRPRWSVIREVLGWID
jgi:ABC-type amino acid transport substrate-binding protein